MNVLCNAQLFLTLKKCDFSLFVKRKSIEMLWSWSNRFEQNRSFPKCIAQHWLSTCNVQLPKCFMNMLLLLLLFSYFVWTIHAFCNAQIKTCFFGLYQQHRNKTNKRNLQCATNWYDVVVWTCCFRCFLFCFVLFCCCC